MTETISVPLERVAEALDRMRASGASQAYTTEIIAEYMGGFHSNRDVPAQYSWNAQFGKILKANEDSLHIRELSTANPIVVNGHPTQTSLWDIAVNG